MDSPAGNTKKSRHIRGSSIFRSFSGVDSIKFASLSSSPHSSSNKNDDNNSKSVSSQKTRPVSHHKSSLTQVNIEKSMWPSNDDDVNELEPALKKTPSLSALPFSLPDIHSGSLEIDFSGSNTIMSSDNSAVSEWERETTTELERVRSFTGQFLFPESNASSNTDINDNGSINTSLNIPNASITKDIDDDTASSPISEASTSPSKSMFDPGHVNHVSISSSVSSTCSSSKSSVVKSKHTSTASTISTLKHFSIISVDYNQTRSTESLPHTNASIKTTTTTGSSLKKNTGTETLSPILHDSPLLSKSGNSCSSNANLSSNKLISTPSPQKKPVIPILKLVDDQDSESFVYSNDKRDITPPSLSSAQSEHMYSPVSLVSNSSFRTAPNLYTSSEHQKSSVSFKDDTVLLGQYDTSPFHQMLSYKKDSLKFRKKVSKASISLPTEMVDCKSHFSSRSEAGTNTHESANASLSQSYKKGHRSRNSVMASISQSSLFKSFSSGRKDPQNQLAPRTPQSSASLRVLGTSPSTSKKQSFADMRKNLMANPSGIFRSSSSNNNLASRKSFLGMPTFSFPNSSSSDNTTSQKTVISLPTPNETSREKLKNKLRASSSLLSLTQSDTMGSLAVAVPVEQHIILQMEKLMSMCKVSGIIEFTKYLYQIALAGEFRKINEASYSEVYVQENPKTGKSKIYKIIPFGNEELNQSPIQDIIQELRITNLVKSLEGYSDIIEMAVVKGKYPKHLMKVCEEFRHKTGVSRIHPELFSDNQLYCIIVQENSGIDLKRYKLGSWTDAESIFWQTVAALAEAEERYQFEHRDLHWGNILITENIMEVNSDDLLHKLTTVASSELSIADEVRSALLARSTLKVTLIDFTLSRASDTEGGIIYTRMDHPEFYRGKGDYQFDVYNTMRTTILAQNSISANNHFQHGTSRSISVNSNYNSVITGDEGSNVNIFSASPPKSGSSVSVNEQGLEWATFCPKTNVMWLHYLVDKLLHQKSLEPVTTTKNGKMMSRPTVSAPTTPLIRDSPNFSNLDGAAESTSNVVSTLGTVTPATLIVPTPATAGVVPGIESDCKSTFEGDLLADEARACRALEVIARATDPRRRGSSGGKKGGVGFQELTSAQEVLKWGIKAKIFPTF